MGDRATIVLVITDQVTMDPVTMDRANMDRAITPDIIRIRRDKTISRDSRKSLEMLCLENI